MSVSTKPPSENSFSLPSLLRDTRVISAVTQIVIAALVVFFVSQLWSAILFNLEANNLTPNLAFLQNRAGFDLGESPDWYSSNSSYGDAFLVGLLNTLRVTLIGLVLATILGVLWGIALLSTNFLVRNLTVFLVEVLRNTPLLVQLFFWYFIVIGALPDFRAPAGILPEGVYTFPLRHALLLIVFIALSAFVIFRAEPAQRSRLFWGGTALLIVIELLGRSIGLLEQSLGRLIVQPFTFISRRGLAFPEFPISGGFFVWLIGIAIALIIGVVYYLRLRRHTELTGKPTPRTPMLTLIVLVAMVVGWLFVSREGTAPFTYVPPIQAINNAGVVSGYASGTQVSPEYLALLVGLVVYTAAFIAEIVRAGILAVSRGQIEAARALGLSQSQMFRMVILPQAMRVILPPLGSQYLNLAKNSTLAIAIAFSDTVAVTTTIMNQSGQSVTGISMIMVSYLAISLVLSLLVNIANYQFRIRTR
jgi:general L-amino acid transport system permease protein